MELLKNLEGMSADEQMSAVLELQKAAMKNLEEQKQVSIGKSAEMVVQGLKKIKSDFETKFDSLNYDIQTKVANLKDGQQGIQGQKGEQGDRGLDGAQGRDGRNGLDGKNGVDGEDGVSVEDAKIDFDGSLIITLSTGREMNVGEVVAPDLAERIKVISTMSTNTAIANITSGTIDGTVIGGSTPAAGTFTTATVATGNITTVNATTVDATNVEVTNIKAKDGTASISLADSTGIATFSKATVISTSDTTAALRVTQLGTGNALLVEDSTNPDATPFVIDNAGQVLTGYTATVSPTAQGRIEASLVGSTSPIFVARQGSNSAKGAELMLLHARAGVGTNTSVTTGDATGEITFWGADGTNFVESASIKAIVDAAPGTNDMPGRLVFNTTADGASSPSERMRIDSAGNVGIGATAPLVKLEVSGSNNSTWSAATSTISGVTLTVGVVTGAAIAIGDLVFGPDVQAYTRITAGSGSSWTVSVFQTVASTTIVGGPSYANTLIRITDTDTAQNTNQPTGGLQFFTSDNSSPTAGVGAYVAALAESITPDTALVFGTRDNTGGGVDANERMRISGNGQTTISGNTIISVTDNTNAALRITQLGTGNAILVEDSTNPDSTPVVIDANGRLIVGDTTTRVYNDTIQPTIQLNGTVANYLGIGRWSAASPTAVGGITLARSRGASVGTNAVVNSGDTIANILFAADDGTAFIQAATIISAVDGTPGTSDMPGRLVFSTTADGASTSTERVRITSAGKTGFATSAPASTVHVAGDTILSNVNVISASYDSVSFSIAGEETFPQDLFFSPDGLKMYVIGSTGDDVNEYNLSTAWVVSSAVYSTVFSVAGQDTGPTGLFFRADGTKMYVSGAINDSVFQYTLSTPWSVATASYDSISFSVAAQEINPNGISFKPNGLSMYVTGSTGDAVYQYTLSTAWNVSTATFLQSFSVSGQETNSNSVSFTGDGSRMFITGSTGDDVNVYNLTTPWDISTSLFVNVFSVSGQDTLPTGIYIKPDGTKMYIIGQTNDTVYQYTVPSIDIQLTGQTSVAALDVQQNLTVYGKLGAYSISASNVGVGTSSPSASAILDAQSTTKGVRMPNMTTTQKNAIASPAAGLMVFDTTLAKLSVYSGVAWETITSI